MSQRKRHYWVLDWMSITLYQNEGSSKFYKVLYGPALFSCVNNTHSLTVGLSLVAPSGQVELLHPSFLRSINKNVVEGSLMICVSET